MSSLCRELLSPPSAREEMLARSIFVARVDNAEWQYYVGRSGGCPYAA